MINSNMLPTEVYEIVVTYNDLGVKIETITKIKTVNCFIAQRGSTEDKMIDVYSYEMANYTALTQDKSIVKGNILKQNNVDYKVVESLNLMRYNQLYLKKVE